MAGEGTTGDGAQGAPRDALGALKADVDARLARGESPSPEEFLHDDPTVQEEGRALIELRILQHQAEADGTARREGILAAAEAEFHDALTCGRDPDTRKWKTEHPELTVEFDRLMARLRFLTETLAGPMEDRPPSLTLVLSEGELGGHRLRQGIAQHPFGPIYLAERADGVLVELLAFRPDVPEEWIDRTTAAALATGALDGEGILRAMHADEDRGVPFLVFEHDDGLPLRDVLQTLDSDRAGEDRAPRETLLRLLADAARSLDGAHRQGVFHRGLCPGAVVLSPPRQVRLRWLGLGTWPPELLVWDDALAPWLAPEILFGRPVVDWRADVYGLGALLYGASVLRPPLLAPNGRRDVAAGHPDLGLPDGLAAVIEACLAEDPQARPPTCAAVADALAAV